MNKIFHIGSTFKSLIDDDDNLIIRGMASTVDTDRVGDIIEAGAWTKAGGLDSYKNNPVILFNHDYNQPIGRAIELGTNDNGLQLKAKIAKSAGHVGELIKEGVLGAFSVGFRVKDAEYMTETDGYKIKDAELLEVSVVTVPANQAATFSLAKSFDSESDYEDFKKSFKTVDSFTESNKLQETEKHLDSVNESMPTDSSRVEAQEKTMSDIDIDAIVAAAVEKTATAMAMKEAERKSEEKTRLEAEQKAAEEAETQKTAQEAQIATAVTSGAEKLMADVEAKMSAKDADHQAIVDQYKAELSEKSEEIQKINESKRVFANRGDRQKTLEALGNDLVDATILGSITAKGWDTDFAKNVLSKINDMSGVAVGGSTTADMESEVSRNVERDIELELVIDPLFRKLNMNAASMVVPTMPDAGFAEWNDAAGAGSGSTPHGNLEERGDTVGSPYAGIDMTNKILTVNKLISRTFLRNETEEDSIIPILPLIRDAMVRSHARAIEHSLLMGGASVAQGLVNTGGPSGLVKIASDDSLILNTVESPATVTTATAAQCLDMRQEMGKYGRRPGDVVYIVSLEAYYDLLEDTNFDDLNLVGDRATKITGEIGSIYGSPVIVSDEFGAKTEGKVWGVAVNARNFVIPVLRGVTIESDYEVTNQQRVLVASQRRGFDQMFSTAGQVVAHAW